MLRSSYGAKGLEAGCDEAGRGCLAGPVFAAAVILPRTYRHAELDDSKVLSAAKRERLRGQIEKDAMAWAVASVSPEEIDQINILNASILAMHRALEQLKHIPDRILVDGNRFKPFGRIQHHCIVKGDATYLSIAAASILAKTYRDHYMEALHTDFPDYGWDRNMGYPTREHRDAITKCGITIHHRKSFRLAEQLKLSF
jgi:ribonuclease HII